jgi:hypothetical protein
VSDFQTNNPPKAQTNPLEGQTPTGATYPRHLFKRVDADSDQGIVVAWAGKTPIKNVFLDAATALEEAELVAAGWALAPVVDEPKKIAAKK